MGQVVIDDLFDLIIADQIASDAHCNIYSRTIFNESFRGQNILSFVTSGQSSVWVKYIQSTSGRSLELERCRVLAMTFSLDETGAGGRYDEETSTEA